MPKAILLYSLLAFRSFALLPSCSALQQPLPQPQPTGHSFQQKQSLLAKAFLVRQTLLSTAATNTTPPSPSSLPHPEKLSYPSSYMKPDGTQRGFSNWLIPHRIMIGQYPGQTPEEGGPSLRSAKRHIRSLVLGDDDDDDDDDDGANVRLFCSLQSEIPPQDDVKAWNCNGGKVYLPSSRGGSRNKDFPYFFGHYQPLVRAAFLEKKEANYSNDDKNIEHDDDDDDDEPRYLYAPILDLDTPDASSLYDLLNILLETMMLQNPSPKSQEEDTNAHARFSTIYIHCWGGRGRAGLVGACLLSLIYPEITADACLEWVQRGYDTRKGAEMMPVGLRRSPQTEEQRKFVRRFVMNER